MCLPHKTSPWDQRVILSSQFALHQALPEMDKLDLIATGHGKDSW